MSSNSVTRGGGILEGLLAKLRAKKANSLIPSDYRKGKILDVGCGSYPYFLINTEFNNRYGVDFSLTSQEVSGIKLKKIDVVSGALPFEDNEFDIVTMLAVFEHIDVGKLNFILQEILRVLKKDGIFIITTPAPWSDKLLHQMSKYGLISKEEIGEHKSHYNKKEVENIIAKSGFNSDGIKSGYFEFGLNMWFETKK